MGNVSADPLSVASLRRYLKLLPDFDDIEDEERALDFAEGYHDPGTTLGFLIEWPAHDRAARVVMSRAKELDGNSYHLLGIAIEALEAGYPLATTVLRRAMVRDTLDGAKSKRYGYAARHLVSCRSSDAAIDDYGDFPPHAQFEQDLRKTHGRKYGFWNLVDVL